MDGSSGRSIVQNEPPFRHPLPRRPTYAGAGVALFERKMNIYSNYIFDLDGTLVDSRVGIIRSLAKAIDELLPGRCGDVDDARIGDPIPNIIRSFVSGINEIEVESVRAAFRAHYDTVGCEEGRLYPGVETTLNQLYATGKTLFICTKKPTLPTFKMLVRLNIANYFRRVVCSDSAPAPSLAEKPAMLRGLIRGSELPLASVLYVGDREEDARAAHECGVDFAWASYGYANKISNLKELLK